MSNLIVEIGLALLIQDELKEAIAKIQEKYKLSNQEMLDFLEVAYHRFWNGEK